MKISGANTSDTKKAASGSDVTGLQINGKYYALVIGINQYKTLPQLKTAVFDAQAVSKVLESDFGFTTKLILDKDATRNSILHALNEYRKLLTENDKLLIYYAGHGYYDKDTDTSYWLPVDAEREDNTDWLQARDLTTLLKSIASRHVLIIADSCYSGTMTRSAVVSLSTNKNRKYYIEKLLNKPARVLISSGGNEPVTDSGGGGHSIFADSLIKSLKNMNQVVFTAEELFSSGIKESVGGRSEQIPTYQILRNSGHDDGDFIFASIKNFAAPPKADEPVTPISQDSRLVITSQPSQAECYVNDKMVGMTPVDLKLPSGTYDIRLTINGYKNFAQKVLLQEAKSLQINHVFANVNGSLIVKSNPDGTMIYIDGAYVGESPQTIPNINPGSHMVELKRDGYNTWSDSVNVVAGENLYIKADLNKIVLAAPNPPPERKVYRSRTYQEPEQKKEHIVGPLPSF
ncbi:MAG: PEGA domain-containing protein [Nitrospirae bacterium]|nr:PEGA domain-containing protein [Nitrospirota bacterium]